MTSALAGRRVVNTRAMHQADALNVALRTAGATPIVYPCIAIAPVVDSAELDRAIAKLLAGSFDWLVLTSANTVHALAGRLAAQQVRPPDHPGFATAVVGPATGEAARRELGLRTTLLPATYHGTELARALPVRDGQSVLLPQSAAASPELAETLTKRGARVTAVNAYRTVVGSGGEDLPALVETNDIDAVVFASPSAVTGLIARFGAEGGDIEVLRHVLVVCIGPETAKRARARGFDHLTVASNHTVPGIMEALETSCTTIMLSKGSVA